MATFEIYRGDTDPALRFILPDDITDLTGASVVFTIEGVAARAPAVVAKANHPCEVQYLWQRGDTDILGIFPAEFEITFADGRVRTVRLCQDGRDLKVLVRPDLG